MNVKKHKDYEYVSSENRNSIRAKMEGPKIAAVNQMLGEYSTDFLEIVKRKKRVKDQTASRFSILEVMIQLFSVHFSFAILQNAKLKMLQIVDLFLEHLDCTAMKIAYTDTGKHIVTKIDKNINFRQLVFGDNEAYQRVGQTWS